MVGNVVLDGVHLGLELVLGLLEVLPDLVLLSELGELRRESDSGVSSSDVTMPTMGVTPLTFSMLSFMVDSEYGAALEV